MPHVRLWTFPAGFSWNDARESVIFTNQIPSKEVTCHVDSAQDPGGRPGARFTDSKGTVRENSRAGRVLDFRRRRSGDSLQRERTGVRKRLGELHREGAAGGCGSRV